MHPYSPSVPRKPSRSRGKRPEQGTRLLALRKAAGLTQIELAKLLGVPHANIAFWEWSEKPPRSDLLASMARALGVRVEDLLGDAPSSPPRRSGPVGKLQRVFELARTLPRRDQELVAKFVTTLVEQSKAS
jgi:transcriptional regulator with XRE-family HTH domain